MIWAFSPNGQYSLKSAHYLAKGLNLLNLKTGDNWVWKVLTSPRIKFFLWLCSHYSILTREVLGLRGSSLDLSCPVCGLHLESILHTLRDCHIAKNFWIDLGIQGSTLDFFSVNLFDWLKGNCMSSTRTSYGNLPWKFLFPFGVWHLWLH